MLSRHFFAAAVAGAFALAAASCGDEPAAPEPVAREERSAPVLFKTAAAFAVNWPTLGTPLVFVADRMKKISGGEMEMRIHEPGGLVPPQEVLDAVSSGRINSAYTTAGYWAAQVPAAPIFSAVPFGPEALEYIAWLYHGNGRKLHQEAYDRAGYHVRVIPCAVISPETSGWFREEIDSVEKLKGMNIRFFGLGAEVMRNLGANPSLLPGGQIYDALKSGELDATEYSIPAIDEHLKFHEIAKNNYFPGWHQQATVFELMINREFWEGLSPRHQAVVETVCMASVTNSLAESEFAQGAALIRQRDQNGVRLRYWSDEMLMAFRDEWGKILKEQKKDPMFKKAWDDLSEFRESYGLWESHAFLPRR